MEIATKRGRRGPKRMLSEDEILDAALDLLDGGGAGAASVRGIAARVGVSPNAVYTYFPGKDAVVAALVERLLGGLNHDLFADGTQPWRLRLESFALQLRQHLCAHPGAVILMIGAPMNGPNARSLNERLLEILAAADLQPLDAARASYLLIVYVIGFVALEVADVGRPGPLASEADRVAARRRTLAETPAERCPRSAAAAGTIAGFISTEQFLWGLRRLLAAITPSTPSLAHRQERTGGALLG